MSHHIIHAISKSTRAVVTTKCPEILTISVSHTRVSLHGHWTGYDLYYNA